MPQPSDPTAPKSVVLTPSEREALVDAARARVREREEKKLNARAALRARGALNPLGAAGPESCLDAPSAARPRRP